MKNITALIDTNVKNCCFKDRRRACDRGMHGEKIAEMLKGTVWETFLF